MTSEEFRQVIETAVKKQERIGFSVNLTPEQTEKSESLAKLLQDDSEFSRFFGQLMIDGIIEEQEDD